jgi:lipopolysaccharide/colanic/teichoic acid biosynthesis glycosyltransferase
MTKRAFDASVALLALILIWPLLILISAAIKLDSRGPIIFRQKRVGRHGADFLIFKFRTMRDEPAADARNITPAGDPRVTKVGRFLRKSKLDELPQLWNVLLGDMSLVGPRPEVPEYVELYPADDRELILSVRPGITDVAALEFRDEAQQLAGTTDPHAYYVNVILPRKLELYRKSIQESGFWSDLGILWRTITSIVIR